MTIKPLSIEDVKTEADRNRIFLERCSYEGQVSGFYTYVAGLVTIPVLLKKIKHRFPIEMQYRLLIAGASSLILSYYAGVIGQNLCNKKLHKELQQYQA